MRRAKEAAIRRFTLATAHATKRPVLMIPRTLIFPRTRHSRTGFFTWALKVSTV